jgi:hypothetical protein
MDGVTLSTTEFFGDVILATELKSSKLCSWLAAVFIGWLFEGSDPDAEAPMTEVVAGVAELANEDIIDGLATAG